VILRQLASSAVALAFAVAAIDVSAQESTSTGADSTSAGSTPVAPAEPAEPSAPSTSSNTTVFGYPAPGTNLEAHLPSSSQALSDISKGDSFDLGQGDRQVQTVHGNADAQGVGLGKKGASAPPVHTVKKGDTLWDLCAAYYSNPWLWPKIWSYNPQLQNPHWIYPGDQLRIRLGNEMSPQTGQSQVLGSGIVQQRPMVPRQTIFLRNMGYIDDPKDEIWGELVGAREEQLLLSEGNHVYMIMRPGVRLRIGQLLTVFRTVRSLNRVDGARMPPGELVAFKGSVKIDKWDPDTRVARGSLIESLDIIERGAKVGPVGRRFDIVPPKPSSVDVQGRVLTSLYPHPFVGGQQVVFIDRGSNDGLVAGNRLFIVRRGDSWRRSLESTTSTARISVRLDDPADVPSELTPISGDDDEFPEETVGEVRIIRSHEYSALALVTASSLEVQPGDRVVARRGR
jgi:hypothetical protein